MSLAYLPAPNVFGMVTDTTCKLWQKTCDVIGACWIYDIDKYRVYLHGTGASVTSLGFLFGVGLYVSIRKKRFEEEEKEDESEEHREQKEQLRTTNEEACV